MNRRQFVEAFGASAFTTRLLAQAGLPTNFDEHIAGQNMATMSMPKPDVALQTSPFQPVYTRSASNLRFGAYTHETRLTPAVVRAGLKKAFTLNLPGDKRGMEAQPLFAPNVNGKDLVLCATMGNYVYAFDANTGAPVWNVHAGTPIRGTTKIDSWGINDNWGILSTPVIDNGMLYAVAWISPDTTTMRAAHWLIKIDLTSGRIVRRLQLPGGTGRQLRKQRAALTATVIGNTHVLFIPWGTIIETGDGEHGYITAVDLDTFTVAAEWNATPNGTGGGIWQGAQGPVEVSGDLYFMTGNGTGDYSESFVRLRYLNGKFQVMESYSPYSDAQRKGNWSDQDLGSGGPLYLINSGVVVGAGKDGILYDLDAGTFKPRTPPIWFTFFPGFGVNPMPADPADLNKFFSGRTHHQHGSPVYWNGKIFCMGENSFLRCFSVNTDGTMYYIGHSLEHASPFAKVDATHAGGMPGGMMCISANGNKDGVLWACVPDEDANKGVSGGRIFAFDINQFNNLTPDGDHLIERIWISDTYIYNKFNNPVVNGGRLWAPTYVATVDAFEAA